MLLIMPIIAVGGYVRESLQTLSMQIKDSVLHNLASFAQMTDELTDISVLKQLVLVAHYILPAGDVTTSFLTIVRFQDMAMKNLRCCMTCMEKETILMST